MTFASKPFYLAQQRKYWNYFKQSFKSQDTSTDIKQASRKTFDVYNQQNICTALHSGVATASGLLLDCTSFCVRGAAGSIFCLQRLSPSLKPYQIVAQKAHSDLHPTLFSQIKAHRDNLKNKHLKCRMFSVTYLSLGCLLRSFQGRQDSCNSFPEVKMMLKLVKWCLELWAAFLIWSRFTQLNCMSMPIRTITWGKSSDQIQSQKVTS